MKYLRFYAMAICSVLILSTSILLAGSSGTNAAPPDKDVNVINTPSNPVPVVTEGTTNISGSVNVSNAPTVHAEQSGPWTVAASQAGSWNVGLIGTPTVAVNSSSTNPINVRSVDNPALQPFQRNLDVLVPQGQSTGTDQFTVPTGKRLVIEFASTNTTAPTGIKLWVRLQAQSDGVFNNYNMTSTLLSNNAGSDFSVGTETTRIYADPGSNVTLVVNVIGVPAGANTGAEVDLSGHFVDVP